MSSSTWFPALMWIRYVESGAQFWAKSMLTPCASGCSIVFVSRSRSSSPGTVILMYSETVAGVPETSVSVTRMTPLPLSSQVATAEKSRMAQADAVFLPRLPCAT